MDKCTLATPGAPPAKRRRNLSADSVVQEGAPQAGLYPTEFLNTLEFSGVPPHALHLREACIMLLRKLTGGLANGTRIIVIKVTDNVVEAEVATGPTKGERVVIPQLGITPSRTLRTGPSPSAAASSPGGPPSP